MLTLEQLLSFFYFITSTIFGFLEEGEEAVTDEAPPSILRDCNLVITRGMRIVVRGPNGAGNYICICVFLESCNLINGVYSVLILCHFIGLILLGYCVCELSKALFDEVKPR